MPILVDPKEYQDLPYQSKLWVSMLSNRLVEYNESRKYFMSRPLGSYMRVPGLEEDRIIISASPTDLELVMVNFKIFGKTSYHFVTSVMGYSLLNRNHKIVGEDLPSLYYCFPKIDHEMKRLEYALSEFDRLISRGNDYIDSLPGRDIKL